MSTEPVDLLLELFNPLHLTIGVSLLVELVRYEVAQFVLIVVSESKNLLEISSLVIVDNVLLFELHDWLSDLGDVFVQHLSLQDAEELRVVVHDCLPVRLSDRVTFAFGVGSVDEDLTLVEADVESTDNCVLTKA